MAPETKILPPPSATVPPVRIKVKSQGSRTRYRRYFLWAQIVIVFFLMEMALWTPTLAVRNRWVLATAAAVVLFALVDRPSIRKLGLALPTTMGASLVLAIAFAAACLMVLGVTWVGGGVPVNPTWPNLRLAWQYVIWALIQQFMLQSFFFVRCEELFGSVAAVWVAATLFAIAHLPSPVLTTATLIGALFFCEMFRRYRSIYPLGIVHGLLGLTISLTVPDSLLHHMRVGIGYLLYR